MAYAQVNVNFSNTPPACNPDPITVGTGQGGVEWQAVQAGYTFTGVQIEDSSGGWHDAPYGDFGAPVIGSNNAGKSTMQVSDTVADSNDWEYKVLYTDPAGAAHSFDPIIRNNR